MCKCTKLEVDLDDDTILLMARATSSLKIKHPCSRSFIDDIVAKVSHSEDREDELLSQQDLDNIHKAVGEAVFNDFMTDAIITAMDEAEKLGGE